MFDSKSTFEYPYTPLFVSNGLRQEKYQARAEAERWLSWLDYPHRPYREDDDVFLRIDMMNQFAESDAALLQFAINDMMALG